MKNKRHRYKAVSVYKFILLKKGRREMVDFPRILSSVYNKWISLLFLTSRRNSTGTQTCRLLVFHIEWYPRAFSILFSSCESFNRDTVQIVVDRRNCYMFARTKFTRSRLRKLVQGFSRRLNEQRVRALSVSLIVNDKSRCFDVMFKSTMINPSRGSRSFADRYHCRHKVQLNANFVMFTVCVSFVNIKINVR